jgi:hypothetical protein
MTEVDELRQQLAAIEHERWADWQKYMHSLAYHEGPTGELTFYGKDIEQWERQIKTPYKDLSTAEQASDMEQVDRYWPLIVAAKAAGERAAQLAVLERVKTDYSVLYKKIAAEHGVERSVPYTAFHGLIDAVKRFEAGE